MRRSRVGLVVGIVSIIVIASALYFVYGPRGGNDNVLINWQMKLTIHDTNTRSNLTIPANIGVQGYPELWNDHRFDSLGPAGYAPLSTRDTSGTIYISFYTSPSTCCPLFTFADFFSIWGQPINGSCVGTGERGVYCQGREDDPTVKFVDQDSSNSWNAPEPVVVDANGNGVYDSGETVLSGSPSNGAPLKDDPHILYTDGDNYGTRDAGETVVYDSNDNGLWNIGESIVYDSNGNGIYDGTEQLIRTGVGSDPTTGASLTSDAHVKFNDTNANSVRDQGEIIVYDINGNGVYDINEPVLVGFAPSVGTVLSSDGKVKFQDTNGDGLYSYQLNEPVIYGTTPSTEWSLVRPWPFMSDGDNERCLDRGVGLSNGKDWIIIIWATLGDQYCTLGGLA